CRYCMPAEGLEWLERDELLSFEEIERLVRVLARMGVDEVRLTGGEPLARRPRPLADDERRSPRPVRRAAGRGRPSAPQRLARFALARSLRRDHATRC